MIAKDTRAEMEQEVAVCRALFEKKTRDYGTSWRVLRLPSMTDQIFIKANRIRSIQESGENMVGDSVRGEFVAMVNYAVMALIQIDLTKQDQTAAAQPPLELPLDEAMSLYDKHVSAILDLMMLKNHDYGEAWRQMRIASMVDLILMKLLRIKQIEDNHGQTIVSEGPEGGYTDIVNYSLFCLVRMTENNER